VHARDLELSGVYARDREATHRADTNMPLWCGCFINAEGAPMPTNANVNGDLLMRIRMEYIEMPDLRLTGRQASRLWNLDQTACDALLSALIQDHFLSRTGDGSYVIAAAGRQFFSKSSHNRRVD